VADEVGAVTLVVPAATDHIRFVRLVVAGLAAKVGFDYDAIEDLRIAVHELCAHLIGLAATEASLYLIVVGRGAELGVSAQVAQAPGRERGMDPLVEQIAAAVVDEFEVRSDGLLASFRLRKQLQGDRA